MREVVSLMTRNKNHKNDQGGTQSGSGERLTKLGPSNKYAKYGGEDGMTGSG